MNHIKFLAKVRISDYKHIYIEIQNLIFQPRNVTCQLSGEDIQKIFKVSGKQLGVIKNKAIKIFNNDIYLTKTELMVS